MPRLTQVCNLLALPLLEPLLQRAVQGTPNCAPGGFETVTGELAGYVAGPDRVMLVGEEEGQYRAVSLISFQFSPLFPWPSVVMFYNEGSPELRKSLAMEVANTIFSRGFSKFLAMNVTGHEAKVWQRTMLPKGLKSRVLGDVIEVSTP